ncbi:MAG: helix-turn-helix domain-containing protein [Muribaculaceae bacterium]|nr:helix-turn-helix domain-containing protein [Roseburia sp.]MCM1431251.1 helix-turn-helix domain-containing protein [Muribaculaceae bacterium]MCM1492263.1 helix-turn-helix domain-containing protein [Muribaculaceae bacterium]
MLSNQKLQNSLEEIQEISHLDSSLYNAKGKLVASVGIEITPTFETMVADFAESMAERQIYHDYHFFKVVVEGETEYILVCHVTDDTMAVCAQMAVCQIRNLVMSYAEQFDRNNFIQNVLLGNMLVVDIFSKAKKHHIGEAARVVYVIDTGNKNNDMAMELVKNLANIRMGDFVTGVDQHSVILVKDVSSIKEENMDRELAEIAGLLSDNLQAEAMIRVRVGYGNVVRQLPEIAQSYQEARMALEVGRVFYAEYDTISYGRLGIGRLIYQLPMSLCEMFIREVFGEKVPEILEDEESMSTISKFFENNLNISETARQLYVHRNTLVYRLERIEKAIGLDIRTFDDAMTFRIAVMVIAHMKEL